MKISYYKFKSNYRGHCKSLILYSNPCLTTKLLNFEHNKVLTIFKISHDWILRRVLKYFQHTFETNCKSSTIKKIMEKCFTYI